MAELQPIIVFHGRHFVRHFGICYRICVKLLQLMCAVITHNSVKNEVCILINGWVTANYSYLRRHFVRHLEICNLICIKLLQVMSGVIPSNIKKATTLSQTVFPRSTNEAYTHTHIHTHTHDDSIRRNAMRCISPNKNS